ncbi:MAG: hypothetical protein JJ891_07730 [Rhizobiaceae bacterium]|jgi:hypothetical protein|nr:hypothetical protein [Rhizobiaceae bacterium]
MMASTQLAITAHRENVLYDACEELAVDLMSIDPALFSSFFQYGEARFVYDNVNKLLDKHFCTGSLSFACTGDTLVSWNEPPVVAVDLEFVRDGIFAFFRLVLTGKTPVVELHHITFQESRGDPEENTAELEKSIRAARR